ncbi:hypothetical protein A3B63_00700 [Candidatus Saccharibacteria bacterium RIFCSPLOWO2_01_FULL_49_22]|nr:MAG: hypothetical protein A3B63_00700 [Candidatus Saccharibacteria bacterium RIFCSPLOWO2_01_FULL_49_22]
MTAVNHAITGSVIALVIDKPLLAIPLAFASHFLQDALPHFGYPGNEGFGEAFKHRLTTIILIIDPLLIISFLAALIYYSADVWVYIAAIAAVLPDFEWPVAYWGFERKGKKPWRSPIGNLHWRIQKLERSWGLFVEIAWYVLGMLLLISLLQ